MGRQFADGNENHVIAKQALSFKMFEMLRVNPNYSCNTKKIIKYYFLLQSYCSKHSHKSKSPSKKNRDDCSNTTATSSEDAENLRQKR